MPFPGATFRERWLRSPRTSYGTFRAAGHCRATTPDTTRCSASSSTSWRSRTGRSSCGWMTCWPEAIASSYCAPRARGAAVAVGPRRRFTSGSSRTARPRSSGSIREASRRGMNSGPRWPEPSYFVALLAFQRASATAYRDRKEEAAMPRPRTVDGGELVARTLKEFGVEVAFGLHGGHLDSLLVGLRRNGFRLV